MDVWKKTDNFIQIYWLLILFKTELFEKTNIGTTLQIFYPTFFFFFLKADTPGIFL